MRSFVLFSFLIVVLISSCTTPLGDKTETFVVEIDKLANRIEFIKLEQKNVIDSIIHMGEKGFLTKEEYSRATDDLDKKIIKPLEEIFGEKLFGIIPITQGSIDVLYQRVLDNYGYNFDDLESYSECSNLEKIPLKVREAFKRLEEQIDSFNEIIKDFQLKWREVSVVDYSVA